MPVDRRLEVVESTAPWWVRYQCKIVGHRWSYIGDGQSGPGHTWALCGRCHRSEPWNKLMTRKSPGGENGPDTTI